MMEYVARSRAAVNTGSRRKSRHDSTAGSPAYSSRYSGTAARAQFATRIAPARRIVRSGESGVGSRESG